MEFMASESFEVGTACPRPKMAHERIDIGWCVDCFK